MKMSVTVYLTALKRMLIQPVNWIFIILFPVVFAILPGFGINSETAEASDTSMYFGVVDQDGSALSRVLVGQLKLRYNINEIEEPDINASLTDSELPWILLIRGGYGNDVLAGRAPALEGYSLAVSDASALGGVNAENITRALMLLGTDDPAVLAAWEETSRVEVFKPEKADGWSGTAQVLGFFGFISMFTAYFIIKSLLDDKRGGMPDRIGVMPMTPRLYLLSGILAAFTATEITVALFMCVMRFRTGAIPNAAYLFALMSLYNLFTVSLVMAIVSALRDLGSASVVMTMCATLFSMLGGLFWPIELVPEFMRRLAWFSPGYWLAQGFANIREISFGGYIIPMLFLLGFTGVAILLGGWKRVQPA